MTLCTEAGSQRLRDALLRKNITVRTNHECGLDFTKMAGQELNLFYPRTSARNPSRYGRNVLICSEKSATVQD